MPLRTLTLTSRNPLYPSQCHQQKAQQTLTLLTPSSGLEKQSFFPTLSRTTICITVAFAARRRTAGNPRKNRTSNMSHINLGHNLLDGEPGRPCLGEHVEHRVLDSPHSQRLVLLALLPLALCAAPRLCSPCLAALDLQRWIWFVTRTKVRAHCKNVGRLEEIQARKPNAHSCSQHAFMHASPEHLLHCSSR